MKNVFAGSDDDSVACIVATLTSVDDIRVFGEIVNDLAFSFITPLEAVNYGVHKARVATQLEDSRNTSDVMFLEILLRGVNKIRELLKEVSGIVWARSCFGMILNREDGV